MKVIQFIISIIANLFGVNTFYRNPNLRSENKNIKDEIALELRRLRLRLAECDESRAKELGTDAVELAHELSSRLFNLYEMFDYVSSGRGRSEIFEDGVSVLTVIRTDEVIWHKADCGCDKCMEKSHA